MWRPDKLIPRHRSTDVIETYQKAKHTKKNKQSGKYNQNQKLSFA